VERRVVAGGGGGPRLWESHGESVLDETIRFTDQSFARLRREGWTLLDVDPVRFRSALGGCFAKPQVSNFLISNF
jgi:hypothetical protein